MQNIAQPTGVFNTPSENTSHVIALPASSTHFSVNSTTTTMGHRSHTVTTRESALAFALYEQALQIDIEPDFSSIKGLWTVGFICNDTERDQALTVASTVAVVSEVSA